MSRYPFTAATILSSKSPIITEYFFSKGGKKSFEDDLFEQFEAEVLLIEDDKDEEVKTINQTPSKTQKIEKTKNSKISFFHIFRTKTNQARATMRSV